MSENTDLASRRHVLLQKYGQLTTPSNVYKIPGKNATSTSASQFPVQLGGYNAKEDEKWAIRREMVSQDNGVVPGVGLATAPEEYFGYVQGKEEELKMNEFYAWVMSQADLSKPETAQWWYGKFPWMRQMRLDFARKEHDLDWKLTEIEVNGPQSDEDFMVLWMIQQNLLKPPTVPTSQLYSKAVTNDYKAGLFSPLSKKDNLLPNKAGPVTWSNPLQNPPAGQKTQPADYTKPASLSALMNGL